MKSTIDRILCIIKRQLSFQIMLGLLSGVILGLIIKNTFLINYIQPSFFKEIGYLFIRLIKFISGPLVFLSICISILSTNDARSSRSIILIATKYSLILTSFASCVGMLSENIFHFAKGITVNIDNIGSVSDEILNVNNTNSKNSIYSYILNIIPNNIFDPFIKNDFLQIILCALLFSFAVLKTENSVYSKKILSFFELFKRIFTKLIFIFSKISPIATFGITVWIITSQDFNFIKSIGSFIVLEAFNAFFIVYIVYGIIFVLFLRLNPLKFWRKCISVQMIAFLTSSTISTLPFAMKLAREKLGLSEEKINLVMPYSTAINMNGSTMHFSLATVFVAHLFNVDLSISQYFLIFFMSIICSAGTAPVPGFSIFLLGNMFSAVGVPVQGVLVLFGINTITDMFRTFNNLTADIFLTLMVDRKAKTFNQKIYNS